jgi:hypothetical protein
LSCTRCVSSSPQHDAKHDIFYPKIKTWKLKGSVLLQK